MLRLVCLLSLLVATDALAQAPLCGAPDAVDARAAARQFRALASTSAGTRQRALDALGPARTLRVGGQVQARYEAEHERLFFGPGNTASPATVAIPARLRDRRVAGAPEPAESLFGVPLPGDSLLIGRAPSIKVGRLRVRLMDLDRTGTACVFHVYAIEGDARPTVRMDRLELAVAGYGDPIVWSWTFPVAAPAD